MKSIKYLLIVFVSFVSASVYANVTKAGTDKKVDKPAKKRKATKRNIFTDKRYRNKAIRSILWEYRFEKPEKYEELKKLQSQNPVEFNSVMNKLIKVEYSKRKKAADELKSLVSKYKEGKNEKDAAKIKEILTKAYDKKVSREKIIIKKIKKDLEKRQRRLNSYIENRNKMISNKFKKLTTSRAKQW